MQQIKCDGLQAPQYIPSFSQPNTNDPHQKIRRGPAGLQQSLGCEIAWHDG